jgi:dipeptidyl-peptidase-4
VPLRGGAPVRVSVRPGTHTPVVSPNGQLAAVLFSSDTVPPDLFVTDLAVATPSAASEQRVTVSPRPEFAAYQWPAPKYVTFTSRKDGATLQVVDVAMPPEKRSGPRKARLAAAAGLAAGLALAVWVLFRSVSGRRTAADQALQPDRALRA